ncbi:MAG: hypothetical protein GY711_30055 [bacterium]|nr:hypothetical protein [bacterium]
MDAPRFASSLSTDPDLGVAEERCAAELMHELGGTAPDLLLAFASLSYGERLLGLGQRMEAATGARHVAGCTAMSIIGGSREIETRPALSLFGAVLPGCDLHLSDLAAERTDDGWAFRSEISIDVPEQAGLIVLGDPFSLPAQEYLTHLSGALPGVPVVGGMASGGRQPGQNLVFRNQDTLRAGGVAIVLQGGVELSPLVSQGCRPIGEPFVVTGARGNVVKTLKGGGAARRMIKMLEELHAEERDLFQRGAFVGLAVDATKSQFGSGDLLVRNVIAVDPDTDAIAIAGSVRPGQTLHFMVRDAASASEELEALLAERSGSWTDCDPGSVGALLFSCGGRGSHMFRKLHHDAEAIQAALGPDLPLAGFFANGEIGPVGDAPYLHGFTASVGLLRARPDR